MGHLLDAIESGDPERVEAAMERVSAERNILEKMKKEWLDAELLYYREGVRIGDECQISAGHITAGELRAAFGRENPLIEAFEKEKGEG